MIDCSIDVGDRHVEAWYLQIINGLKGIKGTGAAVGLPGSLAHGVQLAGPLALY